MTADDEVDAGALGATAAGASVEELVAEAVANHDVDAEGDSPRYDRFREIVRELWRRPEETLAAARRLAASPSALERRAAADLVSRVVEQGPPELEEHALGVLLGMLDREDDEAVVQSVAFGLGRLRHAGAFAPLLALADHPSAEVRHAVAFSLPGTMPDRPDDRGVAALVALSADPDDDVRDWATFGLGTRLDADTPAVRDALAARADDPHDETRAEALVGLARRRDERAVGPLLVALDASEVWTLEVEAAGELADERFFPLLTRTAGWWSNDADRPKLDRALRRCDPARRPRCAALDREVLAAAVAQLPGSVAPYGLDVSDLRLDGTFPDTSLLLRWADRRTGDAGSYGHDLWEDEDCDTLDPHAVVRQVAHELLTDRGGTARGGPDGPVARTMARWRRRSPAS